MSQVALFIVSFAAKTCFSQRHLERTTEYSEMTWSRPGICAWSSASILCFTESISIQCSQVYSV